MMKKILFANLGKPVTDRRTWSGIPYSLYTELKKYYTVESFVVNTQTYLNDKVYIAYRRFVKREKCDWLFTTRFAKRASYELQRKLETQKYDVVFIIGASSIADIHTDVPIVFFADAVFSNMVNYYWFGYTNKELLEYNETQKKALTNADCTILTSHWAKKAAIEDYGIAEGKIKVYHFGSNIEVEEIKAIPHKDFNLLFVGADAKRKGIDTAIKCTYLCNEMDSNNHYVLHVVGGKPESDVNDNDVKVYGYINRNIKEEREQLDHLREISDFFILPTRAECAGIVFGEACAYGLPSISYDTGGVSDYIHDGVTGFLCPTDAGAEEFANRIVSIANDKGKLHRFKENARKLYEDDLNWERLGKNISMEIDRITERNTDE